MDNNPVEDVIDEMMDAYWRTQADTLNPEAGEMLNKALDVWSNEGGSRVPSEGEDKETA